jgi:hypothetical protein
MRKMLCQTVMIKIVLVDLNFLVHIVGVKLPQEKVYKNYKIFVGFVKVGI